MARSVGFICPRAPSQVYAEPKRLVKLGLARATRERTGRRSRVRYTITRAGEAALQAWLASPSIAEPWFESEALLRVFFAGPGTVGEMRTALDSLVEYARRVETIGVQVAHAYLTDPARFGDRGPFAALISTALISTFLMGQAFFIEDWATRVAAEAAGWRDLSRKGKDAWTESAFRELLAVARRHGVTPPAPGVVSEPRRRKREAATGSR
jgi:DNA-binding PadR family transcriptional regulator